MATVFALLALADREDFRTQGIPSYAALASAHQLGTISAKDLVQSVVKADLLPNEQDPTLVVIGDLSAI